MSQSGKGASRCSDRHRKIVDKLDELVEREPSRPLYSKELAKQIGVSTRTLQSAALGARDMTLHGYLRWKRLMAARQKLQHGATGVTTAALESGFWHLSDFARRYRELFGELPSSTLRSAQLRRGELFRAINATLQSRAPPS
jgi:AraC family transcriptional regulator, ethanolamine operon transcriptional activator